MYLYKWPNVYVQIARCICKNGKTYLSKVPDVFEQMAKCICLNCKSMRELDKCQGPKKGSYHCSQMIRRRGRWEGDKILALARGRAQRISTWDFESNDNNQGKLQKRKEHGFIGLLVQVSKVLIEVQGSFQRVKFIVL